MLMFRLLRSQSGHKGLVDGLGVRDRGSLPSEPLVSSIRAITNGPVTTLP